MTGPTRGGMLVFALLVLASLAALAVAQRVKQAPAAIARYRVTSACAPRGPGARVPCALTVRLRRADTVGVEVVGPGGRVVRRLEAGRRLRAGQRLRVAWDGRDDAGRPVAGGPYRFRVTLRRQARSVLLPTAFRVRAGPAGG